MPPPTHRFVFQATSQRITIELIGVLGDYIAEELTSGAVEALALEPTAKLVVLDLRGVTDCTVMARVGLGTLQRLLRRRQVRTAWLVSTPRQSGLATLVANSAADEGAGVFTTDAQVEAWSSSNEGRLESLIAQAKKLQ